MISNHYTMTIPLNGDFTYQNLFIDRSEPGYDYEMPRTVILSNKTENNMIVRLMTEVEGDGADFTGFFLKAGSQLQLMDVGLSYRVGASFETAQAATGELIVSCMHYNKVANTGW